MGFIIGTAIGLFAGYIIFSRPEWAGHIADWVKSKL